MQRFVGSSDPASGAEDILSIRQPPPISNLGTLSAKIRMSMVLGMASICWVFASRRNGATKTTPNDSIAMVLCMIVSPVFVAASPSTVTTAICLNDNFTFFDRLAPYRRKKRANVRRLGVSMKKYLYCRLHRLPPEARCVLDALYISPRFRSVLQNLGGPQSRSVHRTAHSI
jgi:hypothetical protein